MDEVLGFRAEHLEAHRQYTRAVRRFVRELSLLPPQERDRALDEREAELTDLAAQLRKTARRFWRRPASFALSMAGATWRLAAEGSDSPAYPEPHVQTALCLPGAAAAGDGCVPGPPVSANGQRGEAH